MYRFLACILVLFMLSAQSSPAANPPDTYRVAGVVVDSLTGQPLSIAEVSLAPATNLQDEQRFLTSTDGRFLFANLPPGKYRLMAGRRGYTIQGLHQHEGYMTAIVIGPAQDSEHVRFPLSPSSAIAGAVTDHWNDPVREAEVLLFQQSWQAGSHSLHGLSQTTTDDQGRYRFPHLLPGTYAIAVCAHPWWGNFVSQSVQVENVRRRLVESVPREEFTIQELTQTPSVAPPNPALDLVYPITYFPNATSLSDAAKVSLQPGVTEIVDITLRPVPSIHLHVRMPPAAPGAESVSAQTEDADGEGSVPVQSDDTTNIEVFANAGGDAPYPIQATRKEISPGLFELSGIPPGDITMSFSGSQDQNVVTRTQSLQLTANAELDLTPHGALVDVSGVAFVPQDAPDQQADAAEQDSSPMSFMLEFRRKTGESFKTSISHKGEFSLAGAALTPGTYELGLADNPAFQIISLEATGATISHRTIDIPGGQPVKLTVHIAEAKSSLTGIALKGGKPFAGAMILLVPQDPDQAPALFHRDQSDSDGSFAMTPLFPGRYTLLAIENGWDLEWSNPAVLLNYLPNGLPVEIKPNASANFNAKVQ